MSTVVTTESTLGADSARNYVGGLTTSRQYRYSAETEVSMPTDTEREELLANLSDAERREVERYATIFQQEGFTEHWHVNQWIDRHDSWDNFRAIRALNDHERVAGVRGIAPNFYAIVCRLLGVGADDGSKLLRSERY